MEEFESSQLMPGIDPELLRGQIQEELQSALEMPLGQERLELLTELMDLAHRHGANDVAVSVCQEIVWDALESGDTAAALRTLSWVMTQLANGALEPEDTYVQTIAAQMLQVPVLAARQPSVSAQVIRNLLFWMEHFAAETGIPLVNRWRSRHQVELGLGHRTSAREALEIIAEIEEMPRLVTQEADCPIHHYRSRIAWAVNSQDYPRALELYRDGQERTKESGWNCMQPDDINGLLMMPLGWAGEGDAAWRAHERSYRHQSEASQYLGDVASHLRYCASTWNIAEGLELLGNHAHWFKNPEDPWDLLVTSRAAALFLERATQSYAAIGYGQVELGFGITGKNTWFPFPSLDKSSTLEAATTQLRTVSMQLALLYDRRNSNNTVSNRTRSILQEAPLCRLVAVAPLLQTRADLARLLEHYGMVENQAHWALPDPGDWFAMTTPQPIPEYGQLDFEQATHALARFAEVTARVDFTALPNVISATKERLVMGGDQVALLAAAGRWAEVIEKGENLLELGERLDDHRQTLRLATYLVQAYWQLGSLAPARNWLIRADALVDATIPETPRRLLEDLSQLAG